jgi:hypothetical protein
MGAANADDGTILSYAVANGRIVFAHDLDFGTLPASTGGNRPSVVQVRCQDVLPSAIGGLVLRAHRRGRAAAEGRCSRRLLSSLGILSGAIFLLVTRVFNRSSLREQNLGTTGADKPT